MQRFISKGWGLWEGWEEGQERGEEEFSEDSIPGVKCSVNCLCSEIRKSDRAARSWLFCY